MRIGLLAVDAGRAPVIPDLRMSIRLSTSDSAAPRRAARWAIYCRLVPHTRVWAMFWSSDAPAGADLECAMILVH